MKQKLLVIVGPTASGKSKIAINLAKLCNAEIISADSQLVYEGLNIGTAKPTKEEMDGIAHHLISVVKPNEQFDVAKYVDLAENVIEEIYSRNKNIIVVGGTGLYIRTLLYGLSNRPESNKKLRQELEERAKKEGLKALYDELYKLDPESAEDIHPNNTNRVIRALEICKLSGQKLSSFIENKKSKYETLILGTNLPRKELYQRINNRVDQMISTGWMNEVKQLLEKYEPTDPGFKALGYSQIIDVLQKRSDIKDAIEIIKKESRNYAKRQTTWFKKEKDIHWISPEDTEIIDKISCKFLN